MTPKVTVLLVDDHPLLRHGVSDFIGRNSHFQIVGEASDGTEALRQINRLKPQIIILDIDMPNLNGIETLKAVRELPFLVKVVVLTMYKEEEIFDAALDLGAKGYVLKENAVHDIVAALEKVERGEMFISASMVDAGKCRNDRIRELLLSKPQIDLLTPSERRILKLIAEDFTSKEIAASLDLSMRTVENHRQHICNKLNLHGSHSLLKFAFDNASYL